MRSSTVASVGMGNLASLAGSSRDLIARETSAVYDIWRQWGIDHAHNAQFAINASPGASDAPAFARADASAAGAFRNA